MSSYYTDNADGKDQITVPPNPPVWPDRYLLRRRVFHKTWNKYYTQLLYGCSNPYCDTATCLSHQKRVAKGPFRPYTMLSARTLAAFLATRDRPEEGLCPHMTAEQLENSNAKLEVSPYNSSQNQTENDADVGNSSRDGIRAAPQDERRKDPKSFTQNLFDAAAVRLLQNADIPVGVPPAQSRGIVEADLGKPRPKDRTNVSATIPSDESDIVEDTTKHNIYISNPNYASTEDSTPELHSKGTDTNNIPPTLETPEHNEETERKTWQMAKNTIQPDPELVRPKRTIQEHWDDSMESFVPKSMIDSSRQPNSKTGLRTTHSKFCYDHFTLSNIDFLALLYKSRLGAEGSKRQMLRNFGRTDQSHPLLSSTKSRSEYLEKAHLPIHDLDCAQTITYVLGSSEALLRSFLVRVEVLEDETFCLSSNRFSSIVDAFRILHSLDGHPSNIFPSLWQSAKSLYVSGTSRTRNPIGGQGDRRASSGLHELLDDAESAHISKVILAALVGSIPNCKDETLSFVQNIRASGLVVPASTPNDPPEYRSLVSESLDIMERFEDEIAMNLIKRLVRAIATRKHMAGSSNHQLLKIPPDDIFLPHLFPGILSLIVIDLVRPQSLKFSNSGHPSRPSIKGGILVSFSDLVQSDDMPPPPPTWDERDKFNLRLVLEWLRTILMKEWDGKAVVPKCSAVGGTLELMKAIYSLCSVEYIEGTRMFETPFLTEQLDVIETPVSWLNSTKDDNLVHLLSYQFLFPYSTMVSYFRAINHSTMYKAFEASVATSRLAIQISETLIDSRTGRGQPQIGDRLKMATARYLVLEIRREHVLTDAMNQLWRRQKRELMRPLKVRMGFDEGEEGVDHGGVQQEFFRIAIAEALDPKYGAFTTDPVTRMSWFQIGSAEPLYKFELLGMLVSLAIYNGLTLPFTFPIVLYKKLLDYPVDSLADISDGWPDLVKGLEALRDWTDGDVEDVFMRTYEFTAEVFGDIVHLDMDAHRRWKGKRAAKATAEDMEEGSVISSKNGRAFLSKAVYSDKGKGAAIDLKLALENNNTQEKDNTPDKTGNEDASPGPSPMVTNANRNQYITDYVLWLTNVTIAPQYAAFAAGFRACISPKSLQLFTPGSLQLLVEGHPHIKTRHLQEVTRYEGGYDAEHRTIKDFWTVVHGWSEDGGEDGQAKVRKLMEFVTASDRLPVGGLERVAFVVQKNGVGDARLPTSLTCFGRLLLPQYTSMEALAENVGKAIENSTGFGQP